LAAIVAVWYRATGNGTSRAVSYTDRRQTQTAEQYAADDLETMREAISGVSIDEELIALQKAQRGYEAMSKVIQASSDLFDTLLQLK